MTQYNTLNLNVFKFWLNKLKSEIKTGSQVTINHSSNFINDSNVETNFAHNFLLTDT